MSALTRHATVHEAFRDGILDPALVYALDEATPRWRVTPAERRWWENHDAYTEWMTDHDGRHPGPFDDGAAGLHGWVASQDDADLNREQRQALRAIPGFSRTAANEQWQPVRDAIEALRSEKDSVVIGAEKRQLAAYLDFTVATGRVPESREPGGRWGKRPRAVGDPVRAFLELIPEKAFVSASFAAKCREFHALERTDRGHLVRPTPRARRLLRWARDQRARARKGNLSAAEAQLLDAEVSY